MRLLNCGHPAPLLVSRGQAGLAEPVEAALPLGRDHLPRRDQKGHSVPFGADDSMLFYTDGISEARDRSGVFYQPVWHGARTAGDIQTSPGARTSGTVRPQPAAPASPTPPTAAGPGGTGILVSIMAGLDACYPR
jgi:Stage II sporulation protein E (SpoIIE)